MFEQKLTRDCRKLVTEYLADQGKERVNRKAKVRVLEDVGTKVNDCTKLVTDYFAACRETCFGGYHAKNHHGNKPGEVESQRGQKFRRYVCSPPQWPLRWPSAAGEGDGPQRELGKIGGQDKLLETEGGTHTHTHFPPHG